MKKCVAVAVFIVLVLVGVAAHAWVADETYPTAADLPQNVREALPEGYVFLEALRGGKSVFVLMQETDGVSRVLIYTRSDGDAYKLECTSAPLPRWNGTVATIGCSGGLHLFYLGDVLWTGTFHREVDGTWRLNYIQAEDNFSVYPLGGYFWEEIIDHHSHNRYAFGAMETDLAKVDIQAMPFGLAQALETLDMEGYAMVVNPIPEDRLHLRAEPSREAKSLGKYYTGTPVTVLEKGDEWCAVTVLGVPGYMMTRYLVFGADMMTVERASGLGLVFRHEALDAGIPVYVRPDTSSSVAGMLHDDRTTLLGTPIYGVVGDGWMHVLADCGIMGYIEAKHFVDPMS